MNAKAAIRLLLLAILALSVSATAFAEATITIINLDGANEGFNDTTPAAPVGGNPGTTLGQQRQIAFAYAANIWAQTLDSNVPIFVTAAFNPLAPNVLGSAGATFVFRDYSGDPPFPGSEFPGTWYSSALADKRTGVDLNPGFADLNAQFSSNFNFYLGLDNNHGPLNDLVAVLLHELGHGLGFQNFVTEQTGANFSGFPDIYSRYTLDLDTNQHWHTMTNAQRQASAINFGRVVFDGPNVAAGVPNVLSFGSPSVAVTSPASIAKSYQFGTAAFGPAISPPGISAPILLADDGIAPGADACTALPAGSMNGAIAMVDRGVCGFAIKTKIAQDAGALAVIMANNAAGAPPGMAGVDPTITIPTVSLSLGDANLIKAQLGGGVTGFLGVDMSIRAGASAEGYARIFAPNPVVGGSSGSHYDSIAFRNLLMEPAINPDLTHSLTEPEDLTLNLMRDIGWYADADLDGAADEVDDCPSSINSETVVVDGCDTGIANIRLTPECTVADRVAACAASASNHGAFASCVSHLGNALRSAGVITAREKANLQVCSAGASLP